MYIYECVESSLNQDYENLEIIVVDDGSTDATPKILATFGQKIRYVRQNNAGAAVALNRGIQLARGEYIAWLSSDDVYMPGKIKAQISRFHEDNSLSLVHTDWIMINSEGEELERFHIQCPPQELTALTLLTSNFINGSSVLIRRECFEKVGYFNENLKASVDGEMWLKLLHYGYKFGHVSELLLKYRWHPGNQSHNYYLMRQCKDQIMSHAIEMFSAQELFGSMFDSPEFDRDLAYEKLAFDLVKTFNFTAAQTALRQMRNQKNRLYPRTLNVVSQLASIPLMLNLLAQIRYWRQRLKSSVLR